MPVDRSVSGIRVSGRVEKPRPATRFPVQMPSQMNHRRSSVRAAAWRRKHARRTRQLGRLRAQPSPAEVDVRPPQPEYRPLDPTNRRPIRSLTIALLLAAATVAGVGIAAWVIGAGPVPATGVPGGNGPTRSAVTDEQSAGSAATSAFQSTDGAGRPGTAGSTRAASPDAQLPNTQPPNTQPPSAQPPDAQPPSAQPPAALPPVRSAAPSSVPADGPAVVSTLAPGDPGFGWPASAFGSAAP